MAKKFKITSTTTVSGTMDEKQGTITAFTQDEIVEITQCNDANGPLVLNTRNLPVLIDLLTSLNHVEQNRLSNS